MPHTIATPGSLEDIWLPAKTEKPEWATRTSLPECWGSALQDRDLEKTCCFKQKNAWSSPASPQRE